MFNRPPLLDVTLATDFIPSTNIKGEVAGANWLFLLPSLALDQVLCLGTPRLSTLRTLAHFSKRVVIVTTTTTSHKFENVVWHQVTTFDQLPSMNELFDVVVFSAQEILHQLKSSSTLQNAVKKLADVQTTFFWEEYPRFRRNAYPRLSIGEPRYYWLTPLHGEAVTAVPLEDRLTTDYFLENRLFSPSVQQKLLRPLKQKIVGKSSSGTGGNTALRQSSSKRIKRAFKRQFRHAARTAGVTLLAQFEMAEKNLNQRTTFGTRRGVLTTVNVAATNEIPSPPLYLWELAGESGLDIRRHRWGIVASGEYSSRKVLCFLFPQKGATPEYIAKIVRDPRFNARLNNEVRALTLLHQENRVDADTIPRVVFSGHHAQLAMVGESYLEGVPFRLRTSYREDCPYGHAVVDWMTQLALSGNHSTSIRSEEVADGLRHLFARFRAIYALSNNESDFLERQIEQLQTANSHVPSVFQHGDAGTWNMLVQPTGKLAILDWEAAEPTGLPLWDLFYFLRSYAAGASKLKGVSNRVQGFREQFLGDTGINRFLAQSVRNYVKRINLQPEFVQPLFYTCWMHRALKESTLLASGKLSDGYYFSILRLCIQQNDNAALQRLFLS